MLKIRENLGLFMDYASSKLRFELLLMVLLKSLILGSKITNKKDLKCTLCGQQLDMYGHHALSCEMKNMITDRHDLLCDKLFSYVKDRI